MKAIIIDDEKHVREGLLLLARWDQYGIDEILEAENVDDAMALIKEQRPAIVFTDMRMPKKDGIDLLKWLDTSGIDCKTIVISGYDDFHYMRNAIFYKSFDYLLKPIDPKLLNQTLEKAVLEWKSNASQRRSQVEHHQVINEVKPLYVDHVFTKLISDPDRLSPEKIQEVFHKCHLKIMDQSFVIAILPIQPFIQRQFHKEKQLIFFMLTNICNEILKKEECGVCFRHVEKEDKLTILIWGRKDPVPLIEQIRSAIYKSVHVKSMIAVGEQSGQLESAYQSAYQTFLKYSLYGETSYHPPIHLLDYSEDIKWAIQSGNTANIDRSLDRIYQKLRYISWEQLQIWENQFTILRQHWLKEYNIDEDVQLYVGENYWDEQGCFSFEAFKEEKKKEFHDLIAILYDVKYQKEKNPIQQIAEYIRKNYEKDINLRDISAQFYLSREHISRRFKQEFNETITDYIMKIRMEKAKKLLENPHLRIYEVSNQVGYPNERYFSRLFKKVSGYSPIEFRNNLDK
ncbi:response regulator [Bacillus sp. FJAT-50079]|uniref:response regulator transcription factor n=1 Tax=Bacillus sp. FJAT-50079 TaxID=2833577 RepID=UPI001BC9392F|nr:response regulator [Bacillus sp. FJAT-50079]MBS4210094.1 response regulator [Bacillus sp. FJAT-50079]